jgi:hypothetical protein
LLRSLRKVESDSTLRNLCWNKNVARLDDTPCNFACHKILDSPYYVFVARCIVVIVVSLIKIAASNENIECFREYFAVGYRAPDPSFFKKFLHGSGQKISHLEY